MPAFSAADSEMASVQFSHRPSLSAKVCGATAALATPTWDRSASQRVRLELLKVALGNAAAIPMWVLLCEGREKDEQSVRSRA
jgi:hypothetical protein